MSDTQQQLDVLLRRAREADPVVSIEDTRAFLDNRLRGQTGPYATKPRISSRPIFVTGGLMAVLTILTLLFGLFQDTPTYQTGRHAHEAFPRHQESRQTDVRPGAHESRVNSPHADDPSRQKHAPAATPRAVVDDSLEHARRNALYATWTGEQIQASTMLVLDSMTLSRIGLTIGADSTVQFRHPDTNPKSWIISESMKEHPDKGYVTYTLTFTHPDSARKEREKAIAKGETPLRDGLLCAPVLVTNSRGQTFSYRTSTEEGEATPDVGSGRYSGKELVAVRVWSGGPATRVASDTGEYYYLYWFEPTREFLDALPQKTRRSVERARGMAPSGEDASVSPHPIALVGAGMFPNPATSDHAMVEYTLNDERRVAVSVYDITGVRLRDIAVTEPRATGTYKDAVSFEGIPNGYYLLAVTTDRGEQSVRPFILNR